MWYLKFKIRLRTPLVEIIKRRNLKVYYYPITHYLENDKYFFVTAGFVEGEKSQVEGFFREIKKFEKKKRGNKPVYLAREKNFFITISSHKATEEEKEQLRFLYNPKIIHLKPVIYTADYQLWEVACLERKELEKLIEVGVEKFNLQVLRFEKRKIKNFGFLTLLPELTEKQEKAIKLALAHGYYEYPRKITVNELAKIAKLSFSTFQAHLRKAENKIISFVLGLRETKM